eukprot:GILK01001451.1.p1 GENE.GILK01001451.1~~GILK01001451.1.p1  ORF type:complete len:310 (-),score=37.36 GILK01001451.1:124-957(-)
MRAVWSLLPRSAAATDSNTLLCKTALRAFHSSRGTLHPAATASTNSVTAPAYNFPECIFPQDLPKPPPTVYAEGKVTKIKYSPRKMNVICKEIRRQYAMDAILRMNMHPSTKARYVKAAILRAVREAHDRKKFDVDRLWIAEASVGKGIFLKRLNIQGRGKSGTMTRPSCHVRVLLKEKSLDEFFDLIYVRGKMPASMAAYIRNAARKGELNEEQMAKFKQFFSSQSRRSAMKQLQLDVRAGKVDLNKMREDFKEKYMRSLEAAREEEDFKPIVPPK